MLLINARRRPGASRGVFCLPGCAGREEGPPLPEAREGHATLKVRGGDADEQDNEEQAELESEVLRTEVQPKCIKGGAMREYQVRARARAAALSELYPALPLSGLEARGPEARADHGVCRSRGSTGCFHCNRGVSTGYWPMRWALAKHCRPSHSSVT